jgi:hypothetical protein
MSFCRNISREYKIYRLLKRLSRQRVALVLNPGNVWVFENAVTDTEENDLNLLTCLMRGWVEIFQENVPSRQLPDNLSLPRGQLFDKSKSLYRLTDSGWAAIHRTHQLSSLGVLIAAMGTFFALKAAI